MVSLNRVMLIGNVGTDPEMRFTPSGNPVTSFVLQLVEFTRHLKGSEDKRQSGLL